MRVLCTYTAGVGEGCAVLRSESCKNCQRRGSARRNSGVIIVPQSIGIFLRSRTLSIASTVCKYLENHQNIIPLRSDWLDADRSNSALYSYPMFTLTYCLYRPDARVSSSKWFAFAMAIHRIGLHSKPTIEKSRLDISWFGAHETIQSVELNFNNCLRFWPLSCTGNLTVKDMLAFVHILSISTHHTR